MNTSRRGTAPVELVMVLPVLLILCGTLLTVGHAGAARIAALTAARDGAWAKEAVADPGDVLRLNHNPDVSLVEQEAREPYRGFAPLNGGEASAIAGVHFRAWTEDDLIATGARERNDPRSSGLIELLAKQNGDAMARAAGTLRTLANTRFVDPNER